MYSFEGFQFLSLTAERRISTALSPKVRYDNLSRARALSFASRMEVTASRVSFFTTAAVLLSFQKTQTPKPLQSHVLLVKTRWKLPDMLLSSCQEPCS